LPPLLEQAAAQLPLGPARATSGAIGGETCGKLSCDIGFEVWWAQSEKLLAAENANAVVTQADRKGVAKWRLQADRDRSLAARVLVRSVLVRMVPDVDVRAWCFGAEKGGRPFVHVGDTAASAPHKNDHRRIAISIAHAGDVVTAAVRLAGPVGIDVEPVVNGGIVEDALTQSELARVAKSGEGAVPDAFLRVWTAKEAVAKADGRGVMLDFRRIETGERKTGAILRDDDARRSCYRLFGWKIPVGDLNYWIHAAAPLA